MGLDRDLQNYVIEHFQDCLVGRLVKGIVHNINGPIQILSMQLELLAMGMSSNVSALERLADSGLPGGELEGVRKGLGDLASRVDQMEDALRRIEYNVRLASNRGDTRDREPRPLVLNTVLQEELDFWKADLFFKHQVELRLDLPEEPPIVVVPEKDIRDLLDGVLGACVEQLKGAEDKELHVFVDKAPDDSMILHFVHSGPAFPEATGTGDPALARAVPAGDPGPDRVFCMLLLAIAQEVAKRLGWEVRITGSAISISTSHQ